MTKKYNNESEDQFQQPLKESPCNFTMKHQCQCLHQPVILAITGPGQKFALWLKIQLEKAPIIKTFHAQVQTATSR